MKRFQNGFSSTKEAAPLEETEHVKLAYIQQKYLVH